MADDRMRMRVTLVLDGGGEAQDAYGREHLHDAIVAHLEGESVFVHPPRRDGAPIIVVIDEVEELEELPPEGAS